MTSEKDEHGLPPLPHSDWDVQYEAEPMQNLIHREPFIHDTWSLTPSSGVGVDIQPRGSVWKSRLPFPFALPGNSLTGTEHGSGIQDSRQPMYALHDGLVGQPVYNAAQIPTFRYHETAIGHVEPSELHPGTVSSRRKFSVVQAELQPHSSQVQGERAEMDDEETQALTKKSVPSQPCWYDTETAENRKIVLSRMHTRWNYPKTKSGRDMARVRAREIITHEDAELIKNPDTHHTILDAIAERTIPFFRRPITETRRYLKEVMMQHYETSKRTALYLVQKAYEDNDCSEKTPSEILEIMLDRWCMMKPDTEARAKYREQHMDRLQGNTYAAKRLLREYLTMSLSGRSEMSSDVISRHINGALNTPKVASMKPDEILEFILDRWANMRPRSEAKERYWRDKKGKQLQQSDS